MTHASGGSVTEAGARRDRIEVDLTDRHAYRFWREDVLRGADLDWNRHVNNVAYFVFSQEGRMALFRSIGANDGTDSRSWFVASLTMDFLAEARFPGTVAIGTRVLRIGRSSVQLGQGIFSGETCVATARIVMVRADSDSGKPVEVEAEVRRALADVSGPIPD